MSIRIVFKDNLHFVTLSALLLTFRRYRKDMAQLGIFLRLTGKKYFPNWGKSFSQLGNFQGALWGCLSKGLGKLSLCQRKKCFRRQKVTLCDVPNNRDLGLNSFSFLNWQVSPVESIEEGEHFGWNAHLSRLYLIRITSHTHSWWIRNEYFLKSRYILSLNSSRS